MMNIVRIRKSIRHIAAKVGILFWVRKLVFLCQGNKTVELDMRFCDRFLKPDDLVFDVGANRGQSAECYIGLGTRVIAFEPQLDLHDEIKQVCRKSPRLTLDSCGLGGKIENRTMFITDYDQVASLREDWEGFRIGETNISVSTLDAKIAQYGVPRYCKIDVEGWESEVISGLSQPLDIISFEYHLSDRELDSTRKVLDHLINLGSYYCSIREASGTDFLMPQFLGITEFRDRFPHGLGFPLNDGYGDIYAVLKPDDFAHR